VASIEKTAAVEEVATKPGKVTKAGGISRSVSLPGCCVEMQDRGAVLPFAQLASRAIRITALIVRLVSVAPDRAAMLQIRARALRIGGVEDLLQPLRHFRRDFHGA
jgi:hypothetical protein